MDCGMGEVFWEKTGVRGIVPESVCDGIALRGIVGYNGKNFEGSGGEDDGSVGRSARVLRGLRRGRKAAVKARQVEFLTTMRYIERYLAPGGRVIEIGAGTGRGDNAGRRRAH